ncbi:hypothetical protein AK830_g736 [Neonectria ditissima]|uniref:DUF7598 domain-containing protein n=1 Tax=Neonectria ditissima TaxID=78410 RepID=A0A0P7BW28_9HYPO|nr:hypothetical protein AK830_g736 [Neonectria ditissima]
MFNSDSIRGPGMIILQVLRAITLITLVTASVACWTLIIKIDTSNGFFFFDAASLFFTSTISILLAVSELPIAKSYFRRTWPVLSDESGLTWLGFAMTLIGCNILGKLNQPANASDEIGLPFWRLVLAAGVLAITFGILNIVCSFVFRDSANGISARIVRSEGSLATSQGPPIYKDQYSIRSNSVRNNSVRNEKSKSAFMSFFWKKKDGQNPMEPSPRPEISGPIHSHPDYDVEREAPYSPPTRSLQADDEWDRRSPIAPAVKRPPTAMHPIMHSRRSSRYSEANMSRF